MLTGRKTQTGNAVIFDLSRVPNYAGLVLTEQLLYHQGFYASGCQNEAIQSSSSVQSENTAAILEA